MKYANLFVLTLALLLPGQAMPATDFDPAALTRDYLNALDKEHPTLDDYYRFYGEENEFELFFELMCCVHRGWDTQGEACIDFNRERFADRKNKPSMALAWVKSLLPVTTPVHILEVKSLSGTNQKETVVRIGNATVSFLRDLTPGEEKIDGEFALFQINGVHLFEAAYEMLNTCEARGNCTCFLKQ